MTIRTRNTIRLNSKDLELATEIARNSDPCKGSLRELAEDGQPGQKASYCILGTVIAAAALRRHISFDRADEIFDGEQGVEEALTAAVGGEDAAHELAVRTLVTENDDGEKFLTRTGNVSKAALRKWQVKKLTDLTEAVKEAELNGTANRKTDSDY